MRADLHVHSIFSDGEYEPLKILDMCNECGISHVAITDHNETKGTKEAYKNNPYPNITVIQGIELSVHYPVKGGEFHILGYNINPDNEELNSVISGIREDNIIRVKALLYYLKSLYNISFPDEDIKEVFSKCGNIGRPEIAKLMVKYSYVDTVHNAFKDFFIPLDNKLPKRKFVLYEKEAIKYITNAGGIASQAHIISLKKNEAEMKAHIANLINYGLSAIEVYHSSHSKVFSDFLLNLAKEFNLLVSGGSDFHGPTVKPGIMLGKGKNNNINLDSVNKLTILKELMR